MANVIGQALIEVVASGGGFSKSVTSETGAGFKAAEGAASESGTKIGSNLKGKFTSAFSGISTTAKVALGAGLLTVFHTGLSEVTDYQKGLAQLQQGLKTTGGAAGITAPQMENLASSIQGYSGQTDDSIVSAEQLLLTFTGVRNEAGKGNDVFTQTTKIAADMAARLGGDASGSAIQLGKALNDPIKGVGALSRVGVSFTDQQKKSIKAMVDSGNTMGAQKIILGELHKEFGGSAEAVGKTLPGQIEIGKRKFEDLSQSIVTAFIPIFNTLIGVFGAIVPVIASLAPVLAPLAVGIIAIVAATKLWNLAQTAFNFIMKDGSLTTGGWITILILLVTIVIEAYQHSKTFRDIVQDAFKVVEAAAHGLSVAIQAMGDFFRTVIGAIVSFVRDHWMLLVDILEGPIGLAVKFIIDHWNSITSTVKTVVSDVISFLGNMIGYITGIPGKVSSVVSDVISFFGRMVSYVAGMPGKIASAASGMWDGIKEAFRSAIDFIISGWNSLHFKIPGFSAGPVHFGGFNLGLPQIPLLATGGNFNGFAIAGEFGPELIAGSGRVHSRSDTSRMLGNVTIHPGAFSIVVQGNADQKVIEEALGHFEKRLVQTLRSRGAVPA